MKTRNELYARAKELYLSLFERTAKRYESNEIYVAVDHVGFECTRIEELFRPLWGIAPFLADEDFCIRVCGEQVPVRDFITRILAEGTSPDSPRRFDRNVTKESEINFANQCITANKCSGTHFRAFTNNTRTRNIIVWIYHCRFCNPYIFFSFFIHILFNR